MPLSLDRDHNRLTLQFERSADRQASAVFFALLSVVFAVALLIGAGHRLATTPFDRAWPMALLLMACAAVACWNGLSSVFEPDCTTVFDLEQKAVVLTESGLRTRQRGPVPFDSVVALNVEEGFVARQRSVIARLRLANGESWRLGYDGIWVRATSVSELPGLVAQVRRASGLPGSGPDGGD